MDNAMCIVNVHAVVKEWVVLHLLGPQRCDEGTMGEVTTMTTLSSSSLAALVAAVLPALIVRW
jgi:hypothetical protein